MKIVSIGPDKDLLKQGSVSFERHRKYAEHLEALHAVVFARTQYGTDRVPIANNAWSYPTGSKNVLGLFIDAYRIGRRILREPGKWVISAQDPFESGLVAFVLSRVTGAPLLIQEHGDFFSTSYWRRESFANQVRFFVGLLLIRRATCVRVVSERIRHTLIERGVPDTRIRVAPVYTEVDAYVRAIPDPSLEALRPVGGVLVLTMARFVPQKNLSLLIRAFGLVCAQGVSAHLVILGRGDERSSLARLAEKVAPGRITFLDWTEHPTATMKSADIYALSSNYEGWGRVCIEALATGTPLLMTDVGCAGSVIQNGVQAMVVPVGDVARFASSLHILSTNATLRDTLREAGKNTILGLPSIEASIQTYIKTLEACLPSASKPKHLVDQK